MPLFVCAAMLNMVAGDQTVQAHECRSPENWGLASCLSRSLKVTGSDIDQSGTCDFLFTFHNNHTPTTSCTTLTSASEIVGLGYSTGVRWVVSTNIMQFNECSSMNLNTISLAAVRSFTFVLSWVLAKWYLQFQSYDCELFFHSELCICLLCINI